MFNFLQRSQFTGVRVEKMISHISCTRTPVFLGFFGLMLNKNKPFRSKEFMKFLHERRKPAPCCICREKPWTQLHHFGKGGGKGMKPSDLYLARLCKTCADKYEVKTTALIRDGRWEILATFQGDALENIEAWIRFQDGSGEVF